MMLAPSVARVSAPRRAMVVSAQATQQPIAVPVSRRSAATALLGLAALPLLLATPAEAKDAKEAARAAAERKAKLRASADAMAQSGKGQNVFSTSKYQLPEEATTPNMRTLANDRLRKEE